MYSSKMSTVEVKGDEIATFKKFYTSNDYTSFLDMGKFSQNEKRL